MSLTDPLDHRSADYPINQLFLKRWSPRAMSGEAISEDQLMTLFEAARWAPSTYNEQEWRYLYATKASEHWQMFFDLLVDANQKWCENAAALIVVCSNKNMSRNDKPNPVHSFDAGASFENLCLQAADMGVVAHGMAGFDQKAAREVLSVPESFAVEAMIAVGQPGKLETLPADLQEMEKPSTRKPLAEIVAEGKFSF